LKNVIYSSYLQFRNDIMRWIALIILFSSSAALAQTKLYVFDCGSLSLEDISMFNLTAEETEVRELFVPCYLIEHEKGRLLWDGGLPKPYADAGQISLEGGSATYENWIVDQLAAMGITPGDISHAAYSHLHYDHAGAANYFLESKVLMQKAEWEAAFGGESGAFVETEWFDRLKTADVKILEGDHDVFGDGSVKLIYTPGHTPGHQSLYVDLEATGPLILSGDLFHFRANRTLRRPPNFNADAEQTLESMDKIEQLIKETGATLWIEHDKALADSLNKAPAYYD
jgi:N-acyl homoserine lactone hydrolase